MAVIRKKICVGAYLALLFFPLLSHAYVRSMSMAGNPLFWATPAISFAANPTNASGLASDQVAAVFQNALASWGALGAGVSYSFSQSTSVNPVSANDGVNTIFFSSAGNDPLPFQVVAITQVTYYVNTGQMAGADIIFNDQDYHFTDQVGDTGQTDAGSGMMKIYLGDVATHEFGHAWGLDHSTVLRSTLIYSAFSGQFNLGRDDRTALRTLYPTTASLTTSGAITGSVMGQNGGIFGAHVEAINLSTGNVEAGNLSAADGSFHIGDLPVGSYAVLVEPFLVSPSTISYYYSNIDHRFCPAGTKFARTFYSACGAAGAASVVNVAAGAATAIGVVAPSCTPVSNSGAQPTAIANARSLPPAGGAAFGQMAAGGTHYWKITLANAANLAAIAMSYSLFSPLDVVVHLLDGNGNPVAGAVEVDNIENPMPGGHTDFDASSSAQTLPAGTYYLQVSAAPGFLPGSDYPAGSQLLDANGFYLLSVSVGGGFLASAATDMHACASVPNTPQLPATNAANAGGSGSDPKSLLNVGACATVGRLGKDSDRGEGNNGAAGALNLALVFACALFAQILIRQKAIFRRKI